MESVCRSQAYRGFESLPLYKVFQRELEGFFIGENGGILLPKFFGEKKVYHSRSEWCMALCRAKFAFLKFSSNFTGIKTYLK